MPSARPTDTRAVPGRESGRAHGGGGFGPQARPAQVRLDRPVISFTFDHFTRSAARNAATVLESIGAGATFYACASLAGQTTQYGAMFDADDIALLTTSGHEIGCHTYAHLDCAKASLDEVFGDMVRNADALAAMGLDERLTSFAYPLGAVSAALAQSMPSRFSTARGTGPGIASGKVDLARLPANPLFGEDVQKRATRLMEQARRKKAWLIFYTHDVAARPSPWGTSTGLFERIVAAAYANGIEIAPVREVAARIAAAAST